MTLIYTVDASVFVSGYNRHEAFHADSRRLLGLLRHRHTPLIEPTLLLVELAAAIARVYRDESLAADFADSVKRLPQLSLVDLSRPVADLAVTIAACHRLRGSDAVYAAVARRYNTTLVTLNQEQSERLADVIPVRAPADACAELVSADADDG